MLRHFSLLLLALFSLNFTSVSSATADEAFPSIPGVAAEEGASVVTEHGDCPIGACARSYCLPQVDGHKVLVFDEWWIHDCHTSPSGYESCTCTCIKYWTSTSCGS